MPSQRKWLKWQNQQIRRTEKIHPFTASLLASFLVSPSRIISPTSPSMSTIFVLSCLSDSRISPNLLDLHISSNLCDPRRSYTGRYLGAIFSLSRHLSLSLPPPQPATAASSGRGLAPKQNRFRAISVCRPLPQPRLRRRTRFFHFLTRLTCVPMTLSVIYDFTPHR